MGFEEFKREFLEWANKTAREYTARLGIPHIEVVVYDLRELDLAVPGPFYVRRGVSVGPVKGPRVVIPLQFLWDLYEGAIQTGRLDLLYNFFAWSIGHEIGHYYQELRGKLYAVSPLIAVGVERWKEMWASRIAFRLSGKTRLMHNMEFRMIMGKSVRRYLREFYENVRRGGLRGFQLIDWIVE